MKILYNEQLKTFYQSEDGLNWKKITRLGHNQIGVLKHAYFYKGWHSMQKNCEATRKAVNKLKKAGFILVNEFGQFKINDGKDD